MTGRAVRWLMSLVYRTPGPIHAPRLVIVRHHRILPDHERPLDRLGVTRSVFRAQLELLAGLGLAPVTVSEGLAWLASEQPGRRVAMSFDDGYADNVHDALPELERTGARATFYLTAGLIEERRAPWWDVLAHLLGRTSRTRLEAGFAGEAFDLPVGTPIERARALRRLAGGLRVPPAEQRERLRALAGALEVTSPPPCELMTWKEAETLARAGMEVGAHTLDHPFLSLLDPAAQQREIQGSVELIEQRLGVRPPGFAYPGGDYDRHSVAAAEAAGLSHAVTTRAGDNHPGAQRLELARRGLPEGACLGPGGGFSRHLVVAELDGAFDRLRAMARDRAEVAA